MSKEWKLGDSGDKLGKLVVIHEADKIQISPVWREIQLDSDPLHESKAVVSKMLFLN